MNQDEINTDAAAAGTAAAASAVCIYYVVIGGRFAPPYKYVVNTYSRSSSRSSSSCSSSSSSASKPYLMNCNCNSFGWICNSFGWICNSFGKQFMLIKTVIFPPCLTIKPDRRAGGWAGLEPAACFSQKYSRDSY